MENIDFCRKKFEICDNWVYDNNNQITYRTKKELMDENYCCQSCIDETRREQCEIIQWIIQVEKNNKNFRRKERFTREDIQRRLWYIE